MYHGTDVAQSPFTPKGMASQLRLSDLAFDSASDTLVWLEGRSDRGVLVARALSDLADRDLTPALPVRARVGYGGGDFAVSAGTVYFAADGRLYRQPLDEGEAAAITPAFGQAASPTPSPDGRFVVFVHSYERADCLAVVDSHGTNWPRRLVAGDDFYMQPALSPDGARLAYVAWNHPHMPWNGTVIRLARLETGSDGLAFATHSHELGNGEEALLQPLFSPDGQSLLYASDAGGFWNLYLYDLARGERRALTHETEAEIGGPAWQQGIRLHAFTPDGRAVVYVRNEKGLKRLWRLDLQSGRAGPVPGSERYTAIGQVAIGRDGSLAAIVSSSDTPPRIVLWPAHRVADGPVVVRRAGAQTIPATAHAVAAPVTWQGEDGGDVHGMLYRPTVQRAGRAPAILHVHGGPTGQADTAYAPGHQFFTSRGYAVLDVNYRGSTGYGRAYRDALMQQWGTYDLDDTVAGARYLVQSGVADAERLVVMGGSAGGYTVLRALTERPGFFRAGICLFGVSNLFTLAAETHKFEERYMDSLIGPLPETAARYRERSPIFHVDRIVDPIAVFQGADDPVVPPNQAETIVENLRRRGVPHVYHVYPGEGHGWRGARTIESFWTSVEAFVRQYVEFA